MLRIAMNMLLHHASPLCRPLAEARLPENGGRGPQAKRVGTFCWFGRDR